MKENLEKDGNKDKVKGDYGKRTSIVQRTEQENLYIQLSKLSKRKKKLIIGQKAVCL